MSSEPAFFKRYRTLELLGEGAMGQVYLAHDPHLARKVAVKVIKQGFTTQEAFKRFATEAVASAKSRCPNIVEIFDYDILDDGRPFLVMEYVAGPRLQEVIERFESLSDGFIASVLCQILEGLIAVEEKQIVHRDIKPGNILITPKGIVKIADFGIARFAEQDITRPTQMLGAVSYMSPEQITRTNALTHESDLFSVGVIGYLMASGQLPFQGVSAPEVLEEIKRCEPPRYRESRGASYSALQDIVFSMLKREPKYRASKGVSVLKLRKLLAEQGVYDIQGPVAETISRIQKDGVFTTTTLNPKSIAPLSLMTSKVGASGEVKEAAKWRFAQVGIWALVALVAILAFSWYQHLKVPQRAPVPVVAADPVLKEKVQPESENKKPDTALVVTPVISKITSIAKPRSQTAIKRIKIMVTSKPSNALLSVDGVRIGYTPIMADLILGPHRFEAQSNSGLLDTTIHLHEGMNGLHLRVNPF
jgi:serine/threonine protein kinase